MRKKKLEIKINVIAQIKIAIYKLLSRNDKPKIINKLRESSKRCKQKKNK